MEELIKYAEQNGSQSAPLIKDLLTKLLLKDEVVIAGSVYQKLVDNQPLTDEEIGGCGISIENVRRWVDENRYPSVKVTYGTSAKRSVGNAGGEYRVIYDGGLAVSAELKLTLSPFQESYLVIRTDFLMSTVESVFLSE